MNPKMNRDRLKDHFLDLADRDIEVAFDIALDALGIANYCQSAGFMRYGIEREPNPRPIIDNSVADPTNPK